MSTGTRILVAGLLFVLIFVSGFWLSRLGRPRPVALLTVHKLIALAALVFLALSIKPLRGAAGLGTVAIAAIALTGLLFVLTIASGGWLSTDRPAGAVVAIGHRVTPYLTVLSAAGAIYLLLSA
jgi:hypothetical protein